MNRVRGGLSSTGPTFSTFPLTYALGSGSGRRPRNAVRLSGTSILVLAMAGWIGCAGPGPKPFPAAPMQTQALSDGGVERWYDADADGRPDYCERLSARGRIAQVGYRTRSALIDYVDLATVPTEQQRNLILLLDSISYSVIRDAWQEGLFRYCARPSRTISTFPVMSDLCFSEFFGCSPSPGTESSYFDGQRLTNGYDVYANDGNVCWQKYVDYRLSPVAHLPTYLDPYPWLGRELREVQQVCLQRAAPMTVAYCVGTSAAGARYGLDGHRAALVEVDRCCRWLLYATHGRIRFTLMSDHGHSYFLSKRIPLREELARLGYRVREQLRGPSDVVVPEFGMVTCACIYTRTPQRVAKDVVGIANIDLSIYRDESGELIVQNRAGRACIASAAGRYRYRAEQGDPLELLPIIAKLTAEGRADGEGFIDDGALFDATVDAVYPDALHRLWRAFHGLTEHTPDVLVSVGEGYHCGSAFMSAMVSERGVHGNLKQSSSSAFAMTSAGDLPPVIRIEDLRAALRGLGVQVPGAD